MTPDLSAPAWELAERIRDGRTSPTAVVDAHLDRIDDRNDDVNAFITVAADHARAQARDAERALEDGESVGPLHGVPLALKDLTGFREGIRHTFGCRAFSDNVATHTAGFVQRLEDAGAIVIGKTNAPEFGHKPVTDNLFVGPTSTPFDLERNSGGSSGGSAAAVADGMAAIGQGGDAAGSIRIPAAFCGIYGLKPSTGRIAESVRPDAFRNHSPFVDKGILTRSVKDAAIALEVMAGPDPSDPFVLPVDDGDYTDSTVLDRSLDDWQIGYSPDLGVFPVAESIHDCVEGALSAFEREGATVEQVDVNLGHSLETLRDQTRFGLMQAFTAKVADSIERRHGIDFLGEHADDVPREFRERIEAGRTYSPVDIGRMNQVRTAMFDGVQEIFAEYDLLVTPTLSVLPIRNDSLDDVRVDGDAIHPRADWLLTWPFNMTGHPAASIPAGFVDGLPVGMQLVGPKFGDDAVLAASAAFERRRPWIDSYDRLHEA
ncbi:amidase [Natronoglomus mannanivorans]|uniref:Amidase n=1 Tax=Natronoglomus mannanivorans TaxID=2979990 RepID=A0AAP2Z135_9EURY|nr:amidase [Halobacteria archaeon AArc-xg1-1]